MIYRQRHQLRNLVLIQLGLGLIVSILFMLLKRNVNSTVSACLGAFMSVLLTIFSAKVAFAKGDIVLPKQAIAQHKKAMLVKWLLNILLFAVVLIFYKKCDYTALFISYSITLAGYWVSLIITCVRVL